MERITIYEYLEDFDDTELPDSERQEQLEDAVRDYNEEYQTSYPPLSTFDKYEAWKQKNLNLDH